MNVFSTRLAVGISDFAHRLDPDTISGEQSRDFITGKRSSVDMMFGRNKKQTATKEKSDDDVGVRSNSDRTLTNDFEPSKQQIKRATRTRFLWSLVSSFLLLVSVVFLILVEIGDTKNESIRNKIYFIKLDLSDIIPVAVPNAVLINSIAQSLGLHDFYTVGLWGYCEGYNGQGVTNCSSPKTLYWFNPVEIIQSQLLAGATGE